MRSEDKEELRNEIIVFSVIGVACLLIILMTYYSISSLFKDAAGANSVACVKTTLEDENKTSIEMTDEYEVVNIVEEDAEDLENKDIIHIMSVEYENIIEFTSPVTSVSYAINVTRLNRAYENAESFGEWDNRDCHRTVAAIREFLINQMCVEENIAFALMGNCANEGGFGMEQNTYKMFKSNEEAIRKLNDSSVECGYGIVQWTTPGRRKMLAKYYQEANKQVLNFFEEMMVAELVCMYEEVLAYGLFESYDEQVGLEDACGRVARRYEAYSGSSKDWAQGSNGWYLNRKGYSGERRLTYCMKFKELWGSK